ncbi:MAG: UbiA prenyltransferase family protein [Deltaproteobacteria bacterium]|nr:UbiA prenyltransferase family protein [Deltaproteobacteria bacterium]
MNIRLNFLLLVRPYQHIKNLFVFAPLFFAGRVGNVQLVWNAFIAFAAFSLTAGAVYIFNDYHDMEKDRHHPEKRNRPLASGAASATQAFFLMAMLAAAGGGLISILGAVAFFILAAYAAMNIAYTLYLKHVAILDVITIAIGFVLRLFIGSAATGIPLSIWIVVMTFLLALFLALAKRRDDVLIYLDTGEKMRKIIDGYNIHFLNTAMGIMASVVIVAYTIYTTSEDIVEKFHSHYLYITVIFVILGILRYLQITLVMEDSSSPTRIIMKDRFIQWTLAGWIVCFAWILYL